MKRDSLFIQDNLTVSPKGEVHVKADTVLEIPSWFRDKGLYKPVDSAHVMVYGSWAMIMGDVYSVSSVPSMVSLVLSEESTVIREDIEYITLSYKKGDKIIHSLNTIEDKLNFLTLFDLYMLKGKVPWFLDYESVLTIIRNGSKYSGVNLEKRLETLEYINSEMHRSKEDLEIRLRHLQTKATKGKSAHVSLANVHYGALTALTKLTGSYQSAGLDSSLVTTTKKVSAAERILRNLD